MLPPRKLRLFFEEHFPQASSHGLETRRPNEGWKVEFSKTEMIDAETCSATVYEAAMDFKEGCPGGDFRAFARVTGEDGKNERVRCEFRLPNGGALNPFPIQMEELAKPGATGQGAIGFVFAFMEAERQRTQSQLEISREREDKLFDTITELIQETREDRKAHDERIGPIIDTTVRTLDAAIGLVKIHNESNTSVQLAKLEYEAQEKQWEMYMTIGGPVLKGLMAKMGKKKSKTGTPVVVEDAPPPDVGPTRELFLIFEKLSDDQLSDVKRVVGDEYFKMLDDAAHSGRDEQTRAALRAFKSAADKDPDQISKMFELHAVLGAELSKKLVTLIKDAANTEAIVEEEPKVESEFVGYIEGLSMFKDLPDEKTAALCESLGAPLVGVLTGGAEGDDERKAFAAVATLGARMKELLEEVGEADVEERFQAVQTILEDTEQKLPALINRALEQVSQ